MQFLLGLCEAGGVGWWLQRWVAYAVTSEQGTRAGPSAPRGLDGGVLNKKQGLQFLI